MKQFIFYLFIVPNYFSLMVSGIMKKDFLPVGLTAYLVVFGIYICHSKIKNSFPNIVAYLNFLFVYPIALGLVSKGINETTIKPNYYLSLGFIDDSNRFIFSFIIGLVLCIILLILVRCFNLNREILVFILLGLTLGSSLFELYLYVEDYVLPNILFNCILNLLVITCPKSSKIVKRNKVKKKKVVDV